ncbi:Predicted dehydrogenase [Paenibacillus sp. UNC496MF]|uniref:Gfo/Idh/MocA family protein n=1 Tax=Paenibacillus sp. UNC496MF TaxID=1502753 RepID=UPI0008EDF4CF|nr:Gfo/Idh/MocA family oxidoreductase [Paenibacillus sp. UNC496MF]SFJ59832.1 Predicted dehydrogenase [Paenibacillus sp. UNC496MF]
MASLKVAVIGCGTIARSQHIPAYNRSEAAQIKYVIDSVEERARSATELCNGAIPLTNYRDMLDDEEVEAVSICTPNAVHAPIAIDCLRAGKHVLCEKPAAATVQEARLMQEEARRSGRMLSIGVVNRFNSSVNRIKAMIELGDLGELYHCYGSFRAHRSIPGLGGPFTTKAMSGGGVLIDWGVHFLDLMLYAIGGPQVESVSGAAHGLLGRNLKEYVYVDMWAGPPDYGGVFDVEDFVTALIRTSGPTLSLNGAWAQNIGESAMFVEFLGDKGGVKLDYGGGFTYYTSREGALYEVKPTFRMANAFQEEIDSFLASIHSGIPNQAHIDRTIITSEVMDAIYRSAAERKEIRL